MIPFGLSLGKRAIDTSALELAAGQGFRLVELVDADGLDLGDSRVIETLSTAMTTAGVEASAVSGLIHRADQLVEAAGALASPLMVLRSFPCTNQNAGPAADSGSLRRTIERIAPILEASGIALAIDFPAWRGLGPDAFRDVLDSFDEFSVTAVLDVGHAALQFHGQAGEAAEALSGFLAAVRLHDNNSRDDAHRVPGAGSIDWPAALTACWKTGFTGPWMIDLSSETLDSGVLARAVGARTRLQGILEDLSQPFAFTE
jgi:sugar phosphate isomerase/epimerase